MKAQFNIEAEQEYYRDHPPAPWKESSDKLVEKLMRLKQGLIDVNTLLAKMFSNLELENVHICHIY